VPDTRQDDERSQPSRVRGERTEPRDGQRDPSAGSAPILEGIRALHDRLDRLEHRIAPAEGSGPGEGRVPGDVGGPGVMPAWRRRTAGEARWQVSVAVAAAVALQFPLPGRLVLLHPVWLLPALQGLLLLALIMANPRRINRESRSLRLLGLTFAALLSLANTWSVAQLITGLVNGTEGKTAGPLLVTGGAIWLTNIIVFALWYWEFDRGGPVARANGDRMYPDFSVRADDQPAAGPAGLGAGLQRLPVPVVHQRRRVQPHGRAAAVPLGQDGHDGAGHRVGRDRRPGRGPRRQHPQVAPRELP
jgi:hypothetical protein